MIRNILMNVDQKVLRGHHSKPLFFSSVRYPPTYGKFMFYPKYGHSFYEDHKILKKTKNSTKFDIENELWCAQRGSEIINNPRVRPIEEKEIETNKQTFNSTQKDDYDDRED